MSKAAKKALDSVALTRAPGEVETIEYIADVHPGIVKRAMLCDQPLDSIAAAIGISLSTLKLWMETYPEMREARLEAEQADMCVVKSMFELATGWKHPVTGKMHPPNVVAGIFWLKARLKWSDQPPPPAPPLSVEDMSRDQVLQRADDLLRAVDRSTVEDAEFEDGPDEPQGGSEKVGF